MMKPIATRDHLISTPRRQLSSDEQISKNVSYELEKFETVDYNPLDYSCKFHENVDNLLQKNPIVQIKAATIEKSRTSGISKVSSNTRSTRKSHQKKKLLLHKIQNVILD